MPTASFSYDVATNRVANHGWITNVINTRFIWLLLGSMATWGSDSPWRKLRQDYGLHTPWPVMEGLGPRTQAMIPTICSWDTTLWPFPTDVSQHWIATGYLAMPERDNADADDVQVWIRKRRAEAERAGVAPRKLLYVGMGSWAHHNRTLLTDIVLDTIHTLNMDAVALRSTVDDRHFPPEIKVVEPGTLDHSRLFPLCSVIIHHGGAGTASQVIRSSRPGVCVPAMHFQETWGAPMEQYGAGVLLTQQELTASWHADGINALTAAVEKARLPAVEAKARELGDRARRHGGAATAVDFMEMKLKELVNARDGGFGGKNSEL